MTFIFIHMLSFMLQSTCPVNHPCICAFIHSFLRPFICLLLNLWTRYFDNEWTDCDGSRHKWSVYRARAWNDLLWGQEVKVKVTC